MGRSSGPRRHCRATPTEIAPENGRVVSESRAALNQEGAGGHLETVTNTSSTRQHPYLAPYTKPKGAKIPPVNHVSPRLGQRATASGAPIRRSFVMIFDGSVVWLRADFSLERRLNNRSLHGDSCGYGIIQSQFRREKEWIWWQRPSGDTSQSTRQRIGGRGGNSVCGMRLRSRAACPVIAITFANVAGWCRLLHRKSSDVSPSSESLAG